MYGNKIFTFMNLALIVIVVSGCASFKKVAYHAAGAGLGTGAGYFYGEGKDDDIKQQGMMLGGAGGMLAGGMLYGMQTKENKSQYDKGYSKGYRSAQVNVARENWQNNTGKKEKQPLYSKFIKVKVPKREINGVVYEGHYETVETLQ
ncbi:MAG: hypothetical protein GY858_08845 [Candidatus Omnitrophica bacterium]|nr:hypothetical protein [Candidatus Omnitrophota bacterium]